MKVLRRLLIGIPVLYLALILTTGLIAKFMLSGKLRDSVVSMAQARLPVAMEIESADFSLLQWLLLRPAVAVQGLTVGNAPGFPSEHLLEAGSVSVQFSLLSLFSDQVDIRYLRFDRPRLYLDNQPAQSNVQAIIDALARKQQAEAPASAEPASSSRGVAIDGLTISSGAVRYTDTKRDGKSTSVTIDDIDLTLANFSADTSCDIDFAARVFGDSSVRFKGRAGPFGGKALPAKGDLDVDLAPAEIPREFRDEYFGELLREPGGGSSIALAAAMEGDLVGVFQGSGTLTVEDLEVGADPETRLPLQGEVPLKIAVQRLLERPVLHLLVSDAAVRMGEGGWKGQAELHYDGANFWGGSKGAIQNVRIEEFVSAFSSVRDKVFGNLAIKQYELSFAGRNAAEMENSLNGKAKIDIQEGRITLFDLFGTIQNYTSKILGGGTAAAGETEFATFLSGVQIRDRHVYLPDALLTTSSSAIEAQGNISFDKELNFDLRAGYTGTLAQTLGGKPGPDGQARIVIPVRVRGTLDAPKVTPDIGQVIQKNIPGILDSIFGRKKEAAEPEQP
ncbi:MAG: AsmA family protein [Acidobacteria bacterium]|nr:AsmA family protein [Acidobacteriota bacterium]